MKRGLANRIFATNENQVISMVYLSLIKGSWNWIFTSSEFQSFSSFLKNFILPYIKDEWNSSNVIRVVFINNFSGR